MSKGRGPFSFSNLSQFGSTISVPVPKDEKGFIGRECPTSECEGYFKIKLGTGLKGENLPCHCPYCGHVGDQNEFWTKEQIEYAKSIALGTITEAVRKDLKKLEFDHKPRGGFGIGISMKLKPGVPIPIRHYRERQLETEVTCASCTLEYAVYGVFGFCPDCGEHNSLQILDKNLDVALKMLAMATTVDVELGNHLTENALEDCISAFDGFGREVCRVAGKKLSSPTMENVSFQNLDGARRTLATVSTFDMSAVLTSGEWSMAIRCFQKRHLLSHRMGIVDEQYILKSGDKGTEVGRRIKIEALEVEELVAVLRKLAHHLVKKLGI